MKKLVCLGLVAAMVVSLAACGSSNTKSTESKASESAAASESSADQAEAASGLKIALVMSGAANDQGWNQTAYEGTQKACEKYGCELAYTENVSTADIAAVFADYAGSGYDIVIGHGYEFGDPALEVAATYPDTKFICTDADAAADNVASYVMACEQTAYVEGIIAASMTKSGKIGAIGPIPGDSLVKIINGYEDGAKTINPDIDVQTAWTNSFVDTQLAQEAANYNLDVVLDKAIESVVEGSFSGDVYNLGMADGAVEVLLSDNLPDDVKATAEQAIEQIKSGEVEVVRDYTLRD